MKGLCIFVGSWLALNAAVVVALLTRRHRRSSGQVTTEVAARGVGAIDKKRSVSGINAGLDLPQRTL
jgi:hypothetical protein